MSCAIAVAMIVRTLAVRSPALFLPSTGFVATNSRTLGGRLSTLRPPRGRGPGGGACRRRSPPRSAVRARPKQHLDALRRTRPHLDELHRRFRRRRPPRRARLPRPTPACEPSSVDPDRLRERADGEPRLLESVERLAGLLLLRPAASRGNSIGNGGERLGYDGPHHHASHSRPSSGDDYAARERVPKSPRLRLGLDDSKTRTTRRFDVLVMLAALALAAVVLVGAVVVEHRSVTRRSVGACG